jgi:hypothetical protein
MYHATKILVAFIPSLDESSRGKGAYGFYNIYIFIEVGSEQEIDRMLNYRFDA